MAWNVFGHAGSLCLALVASVVLARLLGPSDRGLLAIMLLASSLPVALAGCGLPVAMSYFASRADTPRGVVLGHSLAYAAGLAAVFVPLFWLFSGPIADLIARGDGGRAWYLVGVLVPMTFLSFTMLNHLSGRLDMRLANVLTIGSKLAHLAVVVLAVGLLGWGVAGGVTASLVAAFAITVFGLPVALRDGRPNFHWWTAKRMLRYGLLLQVGTVSGLLNYRLDVLVLQHYQPLSQVGHYVVAQTVAEVVTILAVGFQGGLLPLIARQEGPDARATTTSALVHHGVLSIGGLLVVGLTGPLLIIVAFGSQFRDAIVPMLILLPGMWFLGTAMVVAGDLQGRGRPGVASILAALAAGLTILLDILLIPGLGVPGAALASVGAYVGFGVLSLIVLSRVAEIPVRRLVVPARHDLALYPAAARSALGRLSSMRAAAGSEGGVDA